MRVSLGPSDGTEPRQIDAYTFGFGGRTYRGTYAIERAAGGTPVVVNTLPLDAYLYGVVSREVSASWPRAALQAQAIAARTYALSRRRPGQPYDVVANSGDQNYGGVDTEEVPVRDAVDSTSGNFVLWNGAPARVLYSSCCGGFTAGADAVRSPAPPIEVALNRLGDRVAAPALEPSVATEPDPDRAPPPRDYGAPVEPTASQVDGASPSAVASLPAVLPSPAAAPRTTSVLPYLAAHADPYCAQAPGYLWHRSLAFEVEPYFGAAVAGRLGDLRTVELREIDMSGRPAIVRLIGSRAALDVDSADFRRRLGGTVVRSTRLTRVARDGRTLALAGAGFGHGAGLCQWGARGMAAAGSSAAEILAFYFTGTTLGGG